MTRTVFYSVKNRFRSWRLFLCFALAPPLLAVAVVLVCYPAASAFLSSQTLSVVFCDLEGSRYFDTLTHMMLSDETVSQTVTVLKLGYDDAVNALQEGAADAVIVFPEHFIRDMAAGVNHPVRVISGGADPLKAVFVKEFIESAAAQISAAQSAINTAWHYTDTSGMSAGQQESTFAALTFSYAAKALARSAYYTTQDMPGPFGGDSPAFFYFASGLSLLIFFGALFGVKGVLDERASNLPARLAAFGLPPAGIALYHFLSLLCTIFPLVLTAFAAVYGLLSGPLGARLLSGQPLAELSSVRIGSGGGNGLPLFPAFSLLTALRCVAVLFILCLFIAALYLLLCHLFHSFYTVELLAVTAGIAMAVVGGTLIPYAYLPDWFGQAGIFSFHRYAQRLLSAALSGRAGPLGWSGFFIQIAALLLLAAALFFLTVKRIERNAAFR